MYALFKDGKQVSEKYNSMRGLWPLIILYHSNAIHGTHNSLHFACALQEGYTIEEVKE